jgi:hypothetical protein
MFKTMMTVLLALATGSAVSFAEPVGADQNSIGRLLHGMFDKPAETLSVEPIMVSGDHAIADWAQGQMGGRALLRRQHQSWTLILCAGDGIKSKEALLKAGVPAVDAEKLERDMTTAEAKLTPERTAMFSRFEGLVMMDGKETSTQHPQHHN